MEPDATIVIVGRGLIGTSMALALRQAVPRATLIGIDRDASEHTPFGVWSHTSSDLAEIAAGDIVVLATPVDVIISLLPAVARHARPEVVVTDVGSTKRAIVAAAQSCGLPRFIGGHPMAGAAVSGPAVARADLFFDRPWFITATDGEAVSLIEELVTALGARPVRITPEAHDRLVAAGSHLPQLVASALMVLVGNELGAEGLASTGTGLRDTTRLAASSGSTWTSIIASNEDLLRPLLRDLAHSLERLAGDLDNPARVSQLFDHATRWKEIAESPHR